MFGYVCLLDSCRRKWHQFSLVNSVCILLSFLQLHSYLFELHFFYLVFFFCSLQVLCQLLLRGLIIFPEKKQKKQDQKAGSSIKLVLLMPRSFPSSPHEVCNIIPRMRLPTACINYCQIQHQRCLSAFTILYDIPTLPKRQKKIVDSKI